MLQLLRLLIKQEHKTNKEKYFGLQRKVISILLGANLSLGDFLIMFLIFFYLEADVAFFNAKKHFLLLIYAT